MPWVRTNNSAPIYRTRKHKAARARLLEAYTPGDPCCLCSHPMWPPTSALHADHCPLCAGEGCDTCAGLGYRGLAHGTDRCPTCGVKCNISDGARRGRARQTNPARASREW